MKRAKLCGLLAAFIVASAALSASAATWHIRADGSGDAPTIKAAVGLAAAGDSIVVFPGTYNEHDINVTKQLFIVSVAGETSTIIDAQALGRCFLFDKFTPTIVIKGFTLRNADSKYVAPLYGFGGAVLCGSRAQVDLLDCTFRSNSANLGGAAMARDSSVVTFKRCSFFDNIAYQYNFAGNGGAIDLSGSLASSSALSAVIDSCLFVNNWVHSDGAAIFMSRCQATISHSTFYSNHAAAGGGTITLLSDVNLTMDHTIVSFSDCYGIVAWWNPFVASISCCDAYGNPSGNYGGLIPNQTGINHNISADPWFCNAPTYTSISSASPCAPVNSPCGQLIGRYGPSCGPDLIISAVSWWSTTTQPVGTTTYAVLEMQNVGDKETGQFLIDFYKNRATPPSPGQRGESIGVIPSLVAGATYAFQFASVTSDTCGEWQCWISVDTDNHVDETNETDNLYSTAIAWQPPNQSGWPVSTGAGFHSSPVIAPIDSDPTNLEVAIGCDDGNLYAWEHDGTDVPGFPVTLPAAIWSSPAVGNVYGDFSNEIVVGCDDGALYVYDNHGALLWDHATGSAVRTTPALADLDGDGKLEIICASATKINVLDGRGEPLNKRWPYEEDVTFAGVAVGDVDLDGVPEIAAVARSGESVSKVYLFEASGELHAGAWPVQLDAVVTAGPALGNINISDSGLEVVVGSTSGRVYVITTAGDVWTTVPQVTGSIATSPIIEDVDGNGHLDIVVGSSLLTYIGFPPLPRWSGYVTAIDRTGSIMTGWPQTARVWASDVGPLPSAVALGTAADIMVGSPSDYFFSWYGSGARAASFPIDFGADVVTSAAAGQIDSDNWVEIVVATSDGGVHCRELRSSAYPKSALWWPMYGHDRARTHCYGFEVPSAVDENRAVPTLTALGAIYPNPFNPTTKIAFDHAANGRVELAIYDVSGRMVAVLVDRELEAGKHEVFWSGKTAHGRTAASGVYFCALRTASVSETKKLVLLR